MPILIVEDSPADLRILESILRPAGYQDLVLATSIADAMRLLGVPHEPAAAPGDIDLVLLATAAGSVEACARIRTMARYADLPIIIVPDKAEIEDLQVAFSAGATDYLTKPVKKGELLARVRAALKLKHEMDRRKARERELLEAKRELESANHILLRISAWTG